MRAACRELSQDPAVAGPDRGRRVQDHDAPASTSDSADPTCSFKRSPSAERGLCSPGVSTKTACIPGRWSTARTALLVVTGRGEVIVTFVPTMVFTRVDLPTFGLPTTATNPERRLGHLAASSDRSAR